MNETQQQIFSQIVQMLREHFDASVLIVSVSDVGSNNDIVTTGTFDGGVVQAIGLCEAYKSDLIFRRQTGQTQGE